MKRQVHRMIAPGVQSMNPVIHDVHQEDKGAVMSGSCIWCEEARWIQEDVPQTNGLYIAVLFKIDLVIILKGIIEGVCIYQD